MQTLSPAHAPCSTNLSPATSTPNNTVNIKITAHEGSDLVRKSAPAALSLISPPVSPAREEVVRHTSPPPLSSAAINMDRSRYMIAPPAASPSGDARSNLAVQPAASAGKLKLKKNAVKIVGAAGPIPTTPSRFAPPAPSVTSSPAPGSVKTMPQAVEGYALLLNPWTPLMCVQTSERQYL